MPAILAIAGAACRSDRPLQPVLDTVAPVVHVLSPSAQVLDLDSNGLIDLRVSWDDSAGAVDVGRVRVRLITGSGPAGADTNLLARWRVDRLDSLGLAAEETLPGMLASGLAALEIEVPDTSGNVRRDTVRLVLAEAALARTLRTGLPVGFMPAMWMALCPDNDRLYITVGAHIWVVDPESLRTIQLVPPLGSTTEPLGRPLCVPGDPYLYITETRVKRLDRASLTWAPQIDSSFQSVGIALSRANPDLIYTGESYDAVIGVISRSRLTRRRLLSITNIPTNINDLAVMPGDAKLYVSYGDYGGIWVVDPARDSVLKRISVGGPTFAGDAQEFELSTDDRRLYVAVTSGLPTGVVEIDTGTDSVLRLLPLNDYRPVQLGLSPDGRRLFVTTADKFTNLPSQNVLVDVATMTAIRYFPRPRAPGAIRFDRGVLFRPDGKYIFVCHDTGLDIYVHRQ